MLLKVLKVLILHQIYILWDPEELKVHRIVVRGLMMMMTIQLLTIKDTITKKVR